MIVIYNANTWVFEDEFAPSAEPAGGFVNPDFPEPCLPKPEAAAGV